MTKPPFDNDDKASDELTTILLLLKARRRRLALAKIYQNGEYNTHDLAKEIAAVEFDTTPDVVPNRDYRNVYTSLSQVHLSKLADANIIEYDSDRQEVRPGSEIHLPYLLYSTLRFQMDLYCHTMSN